MHRLSLLVTTVFFALIAQTVQAEDKYTMEDLTALDKQGAHMELLQHMNDIRPSKRDDKWQAMVGNAAENLIDQRLKSNEAWAAVNIAEQVLDQAPGLKQSKSFMKKRGEAGLAGFPECFRGFYALECLKIFKGFVKNGPAGFELLFQGGKMVRLHMSHHSAIPFFTQAFALKDADKSKCGDDDVKLAVKSGLSTKGERFENTQKLAFELCPKELKPVVMETFVSMHKPGKLCKTLQAKGMLSDFQKAYCKDKAQNIN